MREIKFRAWDEANNEMVYSDKEDCFYINTKGVLFMYSKKPTKKGEDYHKDYNVMQYTGLKDKNGVEIFEGDLLRVLDNKNGVLQVEFKNAYVGGWVLTHNSTDDWLSLGARKSEDIEVIGNKYENPELLGETK